MRGAPLPQAERMTVGRGAGNTSGANAAGGSSNIFDLDALTQRSTHLFSHDAPDHIIPAPRREGPS